MSKIATFTTDSFQLASYLLSESCRLTGTDKANPRRVVFIFENTDNINPLVQKFLAYKALVEPHRFFSAQKDLKQLIYEDKNNYGKGIFSNTK